MNARPLRIAYVYRDFHRRGSIASLYVGLAERLALDEDVTAVCSARTREPTAAPLAFETVEPLVRGRGRFSYAVECRSFAVRSTRTLARLRERFDVVHVEGFAALTADLVTVHAVRRAELDDYFGRIEPRARVRRRLSPYVARPQGGVVMSIEQRLFGTPTPLCVCGSEQIKNDLSRWHGVPEELIEVIPYAVDVGRFRHRPAERARLRAELGVSREQLAMLFVGDDFERKGLDTVIEGLARSRSGAELWVVGADRDDDHRSLAASLGVGERVRFLGWLPNDELPSWYSAADVFVLPSRQDGWGLTVIEAMAAGCVVVTSEYTGAHEIVEHRVNGYVLEAADRPEELAALLAGPVRDPETRAAVADRAVATVARFDHDAVYPRWRAAEHRAYELRLERSGVARPAAKRRAVALPRHPSSAPLVSVVTPVHNGEQYLAECIESVLAQTYANWRYLIADNSSTDRTVEIAPEYAKADPRIQVVRFDAYREVISNWNRALQLVDPASRYCKMLLADDWLFPECLERMVAVGEEHPSAGIIGSYRICGDRVDLDALPASVGLISGREICRRSLLGGRYIFGSPTNILFRADLVRARAPEFFDEAKTPGYEAPADGREPFVNHHADTEACYELLRESDFGFVPQVLSYTRLHGDSITSLWTAGVGTWLPGYLYTLLKYGPIYLTPPELRAQVRAYRRRYNVYLLKMALKGRIWRDGTFRAYHRGALERLQITFRDRALQPGLVFLLLSLFF